MNTAPNVLLATCGGWYLPHPAKAFENRGALASLWISDKNRSSVSANLFRRCWLFHLAIKPFYHFAPQVLTEKMFYAFFPLWRAWVNSQSIPPCNVVQTIIGYGTELFDRKELRGAIKVVDCPNSHPTSYHGFWQRECDLWCPGERVPIPQWMFARMNRELRRADLILCPSTFVQETLIENGLPKNKCLIQPFGVDTNIFLSRQVVPSHPRFICVGTICLRKGHQYLFRAFELVKQLLPDAELICVGPYKTDFRSERPRWAGTFRHITHLPHSDLAALLHTCTAFVLPSQEEGFARVLSEAMAAGLPILASHESGATTLVKDGVEGIIIKAQDPRHIADAMVRVASDPELNRKMGEAALQKGAKKNTWQDYGDRLLDAYARKLSC